MHIDKIKNAASVVSYSLETKRKRHLMGGILLSVSLLFGGLAVTVMTMKMEDNNRE